MSVEYSHMDKSVRVWKRSKEIKHSNNRNGQFVETNVLNEEALKQTLINDVIKE